MQRERDSSSKKGNTMALPTLVNKIFAFNIAASKNDSNNKKKRAMWRVYDRLANMLQHWKAVTAIALCGVLPRSICLTYYSIFRQEVQTFKLPAAVAVAFFPISPLFLCFSIRILCSLFLMELILI